MTQLPTNYEAALKVLAEYVRLPYEKDEDNERMLEHVFLAALSLPKPSTQTFTVKCAQCGGGVTQGPQWGDRMIGCPRCDPEPLRHTRQVQNG